MIIRCARLGARCGALERGACAAPPGCKGGGGVRLLSGWGCRLPASAAGKPRCLGLLLAPQRILTRAAAAPTRAPAATAAAACAAVHQSAETALFDRDRWQVAKRAASGGTLCHSPAQACRHSAHINVSGQVSGPGSPCVRSQRQSCERLGCAHRNHQFPVAPSIAGILLIDPHQSPAADAERSKPDVSGRASQERRQR